MKERKFPKFVFDNVQKTATWFLTNTSELLMLEEKSAEKTFDEIYDQAAAAEKEAILLKEESVPSNSRRRFVYCVRKYEAPIYLRSIFGPENRWTERMIEESGQVFVAGKLVTLKDFFISDDYQRLGIRGLSKFFDFIRDNFGIEAVTLDFLESGREDIKFVYIIRDESLTSCTSVYWKFKDGDIYKPFVT